MARGYTVSIPAAVSSMASGELLERAVVAVLDMARPRGFIGSTSGCSPTRETFHTRLMLSLVRV